TTLNESRYILMDYFSPAAVTDENGDVTERYQFSAFGLRTVLNPDFTVRSASECAMEFAFQGQFEDVETGWMNYGYRYYLPALGRWSCKDPIGIHGGFNIYRASANNMINWVDLLGLDEWDPWRPSPVPEHPDYKQCPGRATDVTDPVEKAGQEAGKNAIDKTKKDNKERCGLVCKKPDGTVYTTETTGNDRGCTPTDAPCEGCGDEKVGIWSTQGKDLFSEDDCKYGSQDEGWNLPHMQTNPDGTRTLPPAPKGWRDLWK
ncbi:MAG TPA: RHS repeat-associated core domain-containing protein, partial [Prosthecobacter sp.]|nr:RHS repeat-associated core domain-containing protein [Prosthecobacter sp.]